MAVGFPYNTGDVLSATDMNGLVAYTLNAQTATYTAVGTDQYQVLVTMTNASATSFQLPTDATYNFPVGTTLNVLNLGAGTVTIKAVTSGTTTVASAGATAAQPTLAQYKAAAAINTAANNWVVVGAIA